MYVAYINFSKAVDIVSLTHSVTHWCVLCVNPRRGTSMEILNEVSHNKLLYTPWAIKNVPLYLGS